MLVAYLNIIISNLLIYNRRMLVIIIVYLKVTGNYTS